MKKLLLVLALFAGVGAQAQIVTTTSSKITYEKTPKKTTWYFKPGFSIMTAVGSGVPYGTGSTIGYNFDLGFSKPIAGSGAYWGMELAFGSRGCGVSDYKYIGHNVQFSPLTFGYKVDLGHKLKLDPHAGVYAGVDYLDKAKDTRNSNKGDWNVDNIWDIGMNIGVGLWYDRYNIDFTWQEGFINLYDNRNFKTGSFLIRLGVAF